MNQILYNKDDYEKHEKKELNNNTKKVNIFQIQFVLSCFTALLMITGYFVYLYNIEKKENLSNEMMQKYNISRLYANKEESVSNNYEKDGTKFSVLGIIEIPKIKLSYPILSECTDSLLKIAPCRFSGPNLNENGNLCIAAHNYDNYKFFSKISSLQKNDKILIYDNLGNKQSYSVFDVLEVEENNLSPLELENGIKKQVTLVTCNNLNDKRIIVKAKTTTKS